MPEKVRCAVIGAGRIGLEHLQKLAQCPQASVVALAESNMERARTASDKFRISRSYADYRDLLDQPDIDAVTVAVPNYLHAPVAIEALEARKHVLLEKPMAVNGKEAAKIVLTARKMKRILMVNQPFRFKRETQIAKQVVERGDLGEIYHARCFWLRRSNIPRIGSWFTQKQLAGGGCTIDLGVHILDACLHLVGDFKVNSVSAQSFAKFGPRDAGEWNWGKREIDPKKPFDVEDSCIALLRCSGGRTILLEVSWAGHHAGGNREYGIDLLGTDAGLSLYPARRFRNGASGYETIELSSPKVPYGEESAHHFIQCIVEGKRPLVALEEPLEVQLILDAIYASAASGKEVRLR